MGRALLFIVLGLLANAVTVRCICRTTVTKRSGSIILRCIELRDLSRLERANSKATTIEITDSNITNLPGHQFAKFGATLVTLDLHGSKIETVDPNAFIALTKLENLYLWGNNLKMVINDWFQDTQNLRTLDVSFNNIEVIDYAVFQRLPNLEKFYFDYNQIKFIDYTMFGYLKNLKNVKFEKNPLKWGYRAQLMWQLDNQHVKYSEVWEDWAWMNAMIKECTESGYGEIPHDTVLDCVAVKLIDFAHEILAPERKRKDECDDKARKMMLCMKAENVTGNNDDEIMRRTLEGYIAMLHPLIKPQGRFSIV
ncbi:uncharacterized protein LOC116427901 [Nomia melanderi]|uniref:uncharacterized protein LOC116427901 n=1 Tax=Nomia melanderi TaxID=2448451 RepID=UPI0013043645|nr:leucine-rich repeat and immunoglobulin-like domain-containing nogo receptor-interacting protein 2 [Nomia melanderi]